MGINEVFLAVDFGILPFWILLVVAPHARVTQLLCHSVFPCFLLAPVYAVLLFADSPGPQGAHFFSLEGVTRIFTTPWAITACWIHYLVFDLFIGAWEVRDAQRLGIRHAFAIPSVVLTLLLGPLGLLSYGLLRAILRRRWTALESVG